MRTVKRKVFVAIFMLVTIVNFANNNDSNTLVSADKVRVTFDNAKKGNQLTIKDANGAILHSEEIIKEGTLVKTFNLSDLENGIYMKNKQTVKFLLYYIICKPKYFD